MRKNNKRVLGILALLLVFGQLSDARPMAVQAAASVRNGNSSTVTKLSVPTIIEADQVYLNDTSGELFARGNVKITQGQDTILTDYLRGNQQKTTIWVDGSATLVQPDTELTGSGLVYNYGAKTGEVNQARAVITKSKEDEDPADFNNAKVKREFLTGQKIELSPGYLSAQNATYTGCELKTPDYHVSADKVEVWPGDKMIAHNAKFWIKNKVIFSLPRYEKSLKETTGSTFPSVGYSNDNGVYIRQTLSYPFNPQLQMYANLAYYSKAGFRPQYGIKWEKKDYYVKVETGDYYDDDVWLEKRPEYTFGIPKQRIGHLPVSYQLTASYGKWTEGATTSWHQDYSVYFSGDTIVLDSANTLRLSLGTGWSHIRESANDSANTVWRYDATLSKQWSPRLYTFVANHYTQDHDSLFSYDEPDVYNELAYGLSYAINDRHTVSYQQSHDLDSGSLYSRTYGWDYNMHCWLLKFSHTNYTDDQSDKWRAKVDVNF